MSVVTVAYNAAATIADTLASVAQQSHPDIEHIIIDGGSTDETLAIVKRYPHVAKVISEADSGLYDAMNKGWRVSSGEIVGWLNADDMFSDRDALLRIVAAAEGGVSIVAASIEMVDQDDMSKVRRYYSTDGFTPAWLRYGYAVPHPGFYIRNSVLKRIGGYDLRFPLAADFDLIARAIHRESEPYFLLSKSVVRMRMGGKSFGPRAALQMLGEVYRSCQNNGIKTNQLLMIYRYIHKAMQYIKSPVEIIK